MGIAEETSCSEALSPQFLADFESRGCRTALRATYVDIGGSVAATTAIVVLESRQQADELLGIVDEALYVGDVATVVRTHPLPGTPLDGRWNDGARVGSAVATVGVDVYEKPYLALVTAGPADGRAVAQLPGPWTRSGEKELRAFSSIAEHVARHLTSKFDGAMEAADD